MMKKYILASFIVLVTISCESNKPVVEEQKPMNKIYQDTAIYIDYTEEYGSVCCPRDPLHDAIHIKDFVKKYNKNSKKKITLYQLRRGREGENICFVNLSTLSATEKVNFLNDRQKTLQTFSPRYAIKTYENPVLFKDLLKELGVSETNITQFEVQL